jgi:hypothetical protein
MTWDELHEHPDMAEIVGIVEDMGRLRHRMLDFDPSAEFLLALSEHNFDRVEETTARFHMLAMIISDSLAVFYCEFPAAWSKADEDGRTVEAAAEERR